MSTPTDSRTGCVVNFLDPDGRKLTVWEYSGRLALEEYGIGGGELGISADPAVRGLMQETLRLSREVGSLKYQMVNAARALGCEPEHLLRISGPFEWDESEGGGS